MSKLRFDLAGSFLAGVAAMAALGYWLWRSTQEAR